jgi:hypothetical protein
MTTWGLVSTLKAPVEAVLNFAAWHLELGATRLILHFDDPADPVQALLRDHPRIEVISTDHAYWQRLKGRRPARHQPRQTANATRAYAANTACDWLGHIDVDEFLLPERPVADLLSDLPAQCHAARLRPAEALVVATPSSQVHLKAFSVETPLRHQQSTRIFPTYGRWLNGGMLSHVAGKLFVRKGLPQAELRIHNVLSNDINNPGQVELSTIPLAHFHAGSWENWLAHFRFRLEQGAYRADLKPAQPDAATLHELLCQIDAGEGEPGLQRFFDEVCRDTPALRARLSHEGLLRVAEMDFDRLRAAHFPHLST